MLKKNKIKNIFQYAVYVYDTKITSFPTLEEATDYANCLRHSKLYSSYKKSVHIYLEVN